MEKKGAILMQKYELGRLLGQGTFAKVYYARHIISTQSVAIKVVDKERISKGGLINQIKREISVMRLVKHPNVVQLFEVMASKSKIYFVMEYVRGGELFNKIAKGRLKEDQARKYFQQLVSAIDYCHSRGVYHRDLKPENLLLDENGNLKISDFGLSALHESRGQDGLLHTTCGTPAYVAPEVINKRGYDGAKADIWSCGVVLYVLLAGFLPFHDSNLMTLYRKISKGDFRCPSWFSLEIRKLLCKILDPSPVSRISVSKLMENSWFKRGFKQHENANHKDGLLEGPPTTPRDVRAVFNIIDFEIGPSETKQEDDPSSSGPMKPICMNAFDFISLSPGFDLSGLFDKGLRPKPESRFTTTKPPAAIVSRFEQIAHENKRFTMTQQKDGVVKLQSSKEGRKGVLEIDAEIFEVAPTLHIVEVQKSSGDTIEYNDFYDRDLKPALGDIVWTWQGNCGAQK